MMFPVSTILNWIIRYPKINSIFYKEYEDRYISMMEMVNQAVFHRLDKRILEYIGQKIRMGNSDTIKISHKEIANNLGTAREVVTRLLKKFENEGIIVQSSQGIRIIGKK
jgi:CRP/FNR family transcriptional regulator